MSVSAPPRLHWKDRKTDVSLPPARLSPSNDGDAACSTILGDNALALSCLKEEIPGQVTLAYLDPPFLTGREHYRVERTKSKSGGLTRTQSPAFDDRWNSMGHYLEALEPRLRLIKELLAPHGSVVLHVDPKTSHYAKIICDEIFGIDCFASEVIWRYRRWPSKTKNFQRVHDVMLRYVKDANATPRFNQLYEPLAPSTLKTWGDRKQLAVTNGSGRRVRSSKTEEKSKGTPLGDVWEIGIVAPVAKERTGYPTQKPQALLKRWIEACSSPGDLVLDAYMGSGTTLAVAHELGRRSIGIDVGAESHAVTKDRLAALGIEVNARRVEQPLARATPRKQQPQSQTG